MLRVHAAEFKSVYAHSYQKDKKKKKTLLLSHKDFFCEMEDGPQNNITIIRLAQHQNIILNAERCELFIEFILI